MKTVVIVGSSRKDGDTAQLVNKISDLTDWSIVDLNDYQISYYDYDHNNKDDDFLKLMSRIIEQYDSIILATPVYWYAMSGIMKVFFDRLTDLITIEKNLGRKLRGKRMAAISCSIGNNLGDDFWLPFHKTAEYLGMEYIGGLHTITDESSQKEIENFVQLVNTNL